MKQADCSHKMRLSTARAGKSAIWKMLVRAQQLMGEKTVYRPINPKVSGAIP